MEDIVKGVNPWKGLQSYQENDIIYGRDEEIKNLYTRILYNIQTVVYGKSGIGKSSIINAGIIPRAKYDGMLPVSIRLAHTTKRDKSESAPYVEQIYLSIKDSAEKAGAELEELVPHSQDHEETLWELLHRFRIWKECGDERKRLIPLLLFDQFEEIFTLEKNNKRVESFFSELADLLNEIKPSYLTQIESRCNAVSTTGVEYESVKSRNVFSKIANRRRDTPIEYLEKSDFHIVITLREDFLSYLERYTVCIPVMKQNRFPLLPLNEEQAAKIITEPIKDLIQPDVAEIIIQKVTGRKDFNIDGTPEIEVDAYILSLYMEQLYERKDAADTEISSELVVQSDDIIKKFYEDAIEGISSNTIEYLEDELITNANRRNNVAKGDLLSGGVGEDDLNKLLEKKVLRQFSYGGDLRIEFIHDILCPIVIDRIEHREQLAKEKAEKIKAEEEKERREKELEKARLEKEAVEKKNRRQRYLVYSLLTILFFGFVWILLTQVGRQDEESELYNICFKPDISEGSEKQYGFGPDDYWDVNLYFSTIDGEELHLTHPIDNSLCDFHKGGGVDSLVLTFTKTEMLSLKEILVEVRPKTTLCKKDSFRINLNKKYKDPIKFKIAKNYEETDLFEGVVLTDWGNEKIPLNDVLIVVAGRITYTDSAGHYSISIPRANTIFNHISIIKQGYSIRELVLENNMTIQLERNLNVSFEERQNEIKKLWKIADKKNRKKRQTEYWEDRMLEKFHIDDKRKLKRGLGIKNSQDSLYYVFYDIASRLDSSKVDSDNTGAKIGDIRNIIGTYQSNEEKYIFEGFMTLENDSIGQWGLEIIQYDTIFNTRKKKATLIHSVYPNQTKITYR